MFLAKYLKCFLQNSFQTAHGDPCKQGCEFLHRVVNPGREGIIFILVNL